VGCNTHEKSADREQTFSQLVNQPVSESSESLLVSEVWICMLSVTKSSTRCITNAVGSVNKVDVIVGGIQTRAFIDSGSQVCIVRKQLLPYIKEKQNWSVSNCLAQHIVLDTQPIGAEGSPLGVKALVKLYVAKITGLSLQISCYVMDSSKPIWQGKLWNCGMIMGTNALVGLDFRITELRWLQKVCCSSQVKVVG